MRYEDSQELREEENQRRHENRRQLRILANAAKHAHDPDYIGPEDEEE
jgi:hypothetical protein